MINTLKEHFKDAKTDVEPIAVFNAYPEFRPLLLTYSPEIFLSHPEFVNELA